MKAPPSNSDALPQWSKISAVKSVEATTELLDGIVVAAGFEDRAFAVLSHGKFRSDAHCILVRFANAVPGNDEVFVRYLQVAQERFVATSIHILDLQQDDPARFEVELSQLINTLPRATRHLGLDVSGLPSYATCMALKAMRTSRAQNPISIFYTAAIEYNPFRAEYDDLVAHSGEEIELVPHSMALEMGENLQLDSFSGYRSQNAKSCLAILAGYEAHRANGVVEAVNPSLLLLLYGKPGEKTLDWRLDLSIRLHRKFERSRRTATEVVSTLQFEETMNTLETYYNYLIDDYDLVIAPIGSKMQTLAAYLFWERYSETQLMFPIPIGYDPKQRPKGAGTTYSTVLEPKALIFRNSWQTPVS